MELLREPVGQAKPGPHAAAEREGLARVEVDGRARLQLEPSAQAFVGPNCLKDTI